MDSQIWSNAASEAVDCLIERLLPADSLVVKPFINRLFAALQEGHAFIRIESQEAALLGNIDGFVGDKGNSPLVLSGNQLSLGKIWQLEYDLATQIIRIANAVTPPIDWLGISHYLEQWFDEAGSRDQKAAAALALLQNFMLISGGPGTGKTTTVAKLLALLCLQGAALPKIALAAPTGKAAAHMARALHNALEKLDISESIRHHLIRLDGQTVHRLLKLKPPYMEPFFNSENPLALDVLIVDEASMLDTFLLLQLLSAVPDGCKVILLGDENQLPSVGAGAVLKALAQETELDRATAQELAYLLPKHRFIVSDRPSLLAQNVVRLSISHRFNEQSGIGSLAKAVVDGDAEKALDLFERFPEEISMPAYDTGRQMADLYRLQHYYWEAVEKNDVAGAFAHQTDIVVLAARRSDAEQFNRDYCTFLQKQGRFESGEQWFAGQMIMVSRNDYSLDLFNGDIGLVLRDETGTLVAYFSEGRDFRKMALSRLPECETAFAMTVHKSQGSEYRAVWLLPPFSDNPDMALNRALLYTAVTRARDCFVFWGEKATFQAACRSEEKRRSALRKMLLDCAGVSDRPV